MFGGLDDAWYVVDTARDRVVEYANQGTDVGQSSATASTLPSNVENLYLFDAAIDGHGNSLSNEIHGNGYDNWLTGGDLHDHLCGEDGNDFLEGGEGWDILYGGA